jgi:hypothetical protein
MLTLIATLGALSWSSLACFNLWAASRIAERCGGWSERYSGIRPTQWAWYVGIPVVMAILGAVLPVFEKRVPARLHKFLILGALLLVFPYALLSGDIRW